MKANPIEVGQRIKLIRTNKGLTMKEFASHIDNKANSGTVSNWENGRNLPNNERLKIIADLDGIIVNDLINGSLTDYESMWRQLKKEVEAVTNDEFGNPATQYYLEKILKVMKNLEEEK